jgi:hypothetical protein
LPVERAKGWANSLIRSQHRGPGDTTDAAIHRAAVKYGLEPKVLWRLRYRTPKDMLVSVYLKIEAAYQAECERQEARLRHELEITKAIATSAAALAAIREAEALLGASKSQTERTPA